MAQFLMYIFWWALQYIPSTYLISIFNIYFRILENKECQNIGNIEEKMN